jgi:hypothetical protein
MDVIIKSEFWIKIFSDVFWITYLCVKIFHNPIVFERDSRILRFFLINLDSRNPRALPSAHLDPSLGPVSPDERG